MSGINAAYSVKRDSLGYELVEWAHSAGVFERLRGEEGAGIAVANPYGIKTYKGLGPVEQVLTQKYLDLLKSPDDFGVVQHDRFGREKYPTDENNQPVKVETEHYEAYVVADSKIAAWDAIKSMFGAGLATKTGSEVFGLLLLRELERTGGSMQDAGEKFFYNMDGKGTYSVSMLLIKKDTGDISLVSIRDPYGGQPFFTAKDDDTYKFSSGTYPLKSRLVKLDHISDVPRATISVISEHGPELYEYGTTYKRHCSCCGFETIYYGSPYDRILVELGPRFYELYDKYFEKISKALGVNPDYKDYFRKYPSNLLLRYIFGISLVERNDEELTDVDNLISIPFTGTGVTQGIAIATGLPYASQAFHKNLGRSFQDPNPDSQKFKVDTKLSALSEFILGNRTLDGEDSIVFGSVTGKVSKKRGALGSLEMFGAKSADLWVSGPALYYPCFRNFSEYGLRRPLAAENMAHLSREELQKNVAEALSLGLQIPVKVHYQELGDMRDILGPNFALCCMDGDYRAIDHKYVPDWVKAQIDYSNSLKRWV